LLIDAASLIYRALYSTPDSIKAENGVPMNAAYGFLSMLARLIGDRNPDYLCCAEDTDWRPEWRVELLGGYKAHRAEEGSQQEEAEEKLAPQIPIIGAVLQAFGIRSVGFPDYEAEDVIGTLANRAPGRTEIVSGDRDLFQVVRDPNISVLYPKRGVSEMHVVDEAYIEENYGIPGRAYKDFAVLRGDPSDGLPGVKGVGPKLASDLIRRYGSIEGIVDAIENGEQSVVLDKVRRDLDYVKRAAQVVAIPTDLPIPDVDLTRPRKEPDPKILSLAEKNGVGGPVLRLTAAVTGKTVDALPERNRG
jgi:5'-3' exonuclease